MPITGLERYIKTVLKMPSEGMKSELITRLNNMSGLSGTPMSPLLTKWIQSRIGLFAVQKIQNYVAGGFTPDELRRFNGVFPDTFEGSVIRNELYDSLNGGGVAPPVANFSGSPTTVYEGGTVNFTDLSTNTPTSWSWAFAGGTPATSTTQNPSVVYNTAGVYGVDLTATNAGGSDSESKPNYITVNYPYLLDLYPGASGAYSIRRLSSTYTGAAIRVRRSSDNTEQDIGFSGVNLDETALTTFVGANDGFVTKWYDQSGNNKDGIQTTANDQPRIVSSGVVDKVNLKAAVNFISSDLFTLSSSISGNTDYSCFTVGRRPNSANRLVYFGTSDVSSAPYVLMHFNDGKHYISNRTKYATYNETSTNQLLLSSFNISSNLSAYQNGVSKALTVTGYSSSGNFNQIGRSGISTGFNSTGYIQEVVFYSNDQSANRVGIETDIINYYAI